MESKPPPLPPVEYHTPRPPEGKGGVNRWWMVLLRILAGCVGGIGAVVVGYWLAMTTNIVLLGYVPFLVMLGAALFISIKYRRFGYTSGLIVAPFVMAACLVVLLLIICGGGAIMHK